MKNSKKENGLKKNVLREIKRSLNIYKVKITERDNVD